MYNFDTNLVTKISTNSLNQNAKRPLNTSLDCSKIISHLDTKLSSLEQSFRKLF